MTQTEIKYLLFKGIAKKEQILFKSFMNLAKHELPFQVVIDKEASVFDLVIVDEVYEWAEGEADLKALPQLLIGDDMENEQTNYLTRPVQWSDFRSALASLDFSQSIEPELVEPELVEPELVEPELVEPELVEPEPDLLEVELLDEVQGTQPSKEELLNDASTDAPLPEMALEIENEPGLPLHASDDELSGGGQAYEFELMNMSIDYKSVTNSEYERAAEEVNQFNDDDVAVAAEPVLLVADEESSFNSSVLVIETNLSEEWDINSELEESEQTFSDEESELQERQGMPVSDNEPFWNEDHEIIVDNKSLFYVKTQRDMVYSPKEPGHWTDAFLEGTFSKLPMKQAWRPFKGLKPYPVIYVNWAHTYAKQRNSLHKSLNDQEAYLLDQWPEFELLELDNNLLKLCSLLFVKPETVNSLVRKSKCSREQVIGFMNACQLFGLLTTMDQMQIMQPSNSDMDESMFGKIKDVFK